MNHELWSTSNQFHLGGLEKELEIWHYNHSEMPIQNHMVLIAKPINIQEQDLEDMAETLPKIWEQEGKVKGEVIENYPVQFHFDYEFDQIFILRNQPILFNSWCVALSAREPHPGPGFLSTILVWVQFYNLPPQYTSVSTVKTIGQTLGDVIQTNIQDFALDGELKVRVRILLNANCRLRLFKRIKFQDRVRIKITLHYEKINNMCVNYQQINHSTPTCTYVPHPSEYNSPTKRMARMDSFSSEGSNNYKITIPLTQLANEETEDRNITQDQEDLLDSTANKHKKKRCRNQKKEDHKKLKSLSD